MASVFDEYAQECMAERQKPLLLQLTGLLINQGCYTL